MFYVWQMYDGTWHVDAETSAPQWAREAARPGEKGFSTRAEAEAFRSKLNSTHTRAAFATELTPEGEQSVIPGCERNESPAATQLDLFG